MSDFLKKKEEKISKIRRNRNKNTIGAVSLHSSQSRRIIKSSLFFQKCVSIQNTLIITLTFLILSLIIEGVIGLATIITFSSDTSIQKREKLFESVYEKIEDFTTRPKIFAEAVAASMKSGLLDFGNISQKILEEYMWDSVVDNYDRFGVTYFPFFVSDADYKSYTMYYFNEGFINLIVTVDGENQIQSCRVNNVTGKCIPEIDGGVIVLLPFNKNTSAVYYSQYIYSSKYLPPYLYMCPSQYCNMLVSYSIPYHNEENDYMGMVGYSLDLETLNGYLRERTEQSSVSFIIDRSTGKFVGSSTEDITIVVQEEDTAYQVSVSESEGNWVAKSIYEKVKNEEISPGERMQMTFSIYYVDYSIFKDEGIDWLVVKYTPIWTFYSSLIVFSISFGCVLLMVIVLSITAGSFLTGFVKKGLNELKNEMLKAEYLAFEDIKQSKSFFREIKLLDDSFQFLKDRLNEFSLFLPESLKQKLRGAYNEGSESTVLSDTSTESEYTRKKKNEKNKESVLIQNSSDNSNDTTHSMTNFSQIASPGAKYQEKKKITLAYVKFFPSGFLPLETEYGEFLSFVQEFCKRGTLLSFTESEMMVGFNVNLSLLSHAEFGIKFAVQLNEKIGERFLFTTAVESGEGKINILGTNTAKSQMVYGSVLKKVKFLMKNCFVFGSETIKHQMLVGEQCLKEFKNMCNMEEKRDKINLFGITTLDMILTEKMEFQKVYLLWSQIQPRDGEWMYVLEAKEKILELKEKDKNVWALLESNKYDELLEILKGNEMVKYEYWREKVFQLKTENKTFQQHCEECKKDYLPGTILTREPRTFIEKKK